MDAPVTTVWLVARQGRRRLGPEGGAGLLGDLCAAERGHGVQVALALEHWRPTRAEAQAEPLEPPAWQLSLWAGVGP